MPIVSKYSNERVENIIQELINVLINHDAPADLGLMCLGNAVSHIINNQITAQQRETVGNNFANALQKSIKK